MIFSLQCRKQRLPSWVLESGMMAAWVSLKMVRTSTGGSIYYAETTGRKPNVFHCFTKILCPCKASVIFTIRTCCLEEQAFFERILRHFLSLHTFVKFFVEFGSTYFQIQINVFVGFAMNLPNSN